MKFIEKKDLSRCTVRKSLEILGGKWKLLMIYYLKSQQPLRYGELKRLMPDISEKMLIQELKSLVKNGVLKRKSYPEIPPRVEYSLTEKGKEVLPIIDLLNSFGDDYIV